jgi:hypothetical protein
MFREGSAVIQANLKYGDVRVWEDMPQNAPRSVIEPPLVIGLQMLFEGQALRFYRCSRRRILHIVKSSRESIEIMDSARMLDSQDLTSSRHPMRRYNTNRPRLGQGLA